MVRHQRGPVRIAEAVERTHPPTSHPLQKMFQCPYFFFDIVYIHNGTEEKEEDMSWKVRCHHREWRGHLGTSDLGLPLPAIDPVLQSLTIPYISTLSWWLGLGRPLLWQPMEQAQPRHTIPSTPPYS